MAIQVATVYAGLNYFGANDGATWNLVGTTGSRTFQKYIAFPTPFGTVPVINVALSSFSVMGVDGEIKLHIDRANITVDGFDLNIFTWDSCQVVGVGVTYIGQG